MPKKWISSVLAVATAGVVGVTGAAATATATSGSETVAAPTAQIEASTTNRTVRKVRGRQIRIVIKGDRMGKRAKLKIRGFRGQAKGVKRTVRVRNRKTVRRMKTGIYKIRAFQIKSGNRVTKHTIVPRRGRVRVTLRRGPSVLVRYRVVRPTPTPTPVLQAQTVTAGHLHTCALETTGKAHCWGSDSNGEVGNGSVNQDAKHAPVAVAGGRSFTTVSAGDAHTCALDATGKAYCWGRDEHGQVGDGTTNQADKHSPAAVAGNQTFKNISAGGDHTCALDTTGKAYCWGRDEHGQVGDGATNQADKHSPAAVAGNRTFKNISAGGDHTCALDTTGKAYCWGTDSSGQLGDGGTNAGANAPVAVAGARSFTTVSTGADHSCALDTDGKAHCWGMNFDGQVGDGDRSQGRKTTPAVVSGGRSFKWITAGFKHSCALDTSGKAWCWGRDDQGQVGDSASSLADKFVPVAVVGGHSFHRIAAGEAHSCGIDTARKAYCWGRDGWGQVGDGSGNSGSKPAPVAVAGGLSFGIG